MRWWLWWSGFAAAAACSYIDNRRWGMAALACGFLAFYTWQAHRSNRKQPAPCKHVLPGDEASSAIAAGLLTIKPDEVADIEVTTRNGEHARFSVWRNQ